MYTDTHTHIYTDEFDNDRAEVVERARQAGARRLLLPNIDEASIRPMMQLCDRYPGFCFPMMGLHPTELPDDPLPLLERMHHLLTTPHHPYIAVGEVGLDFYWDDTRRTDQIEVLRLQVEWARDLHLPLMIHARAAHRELVDTLRPLRHDIGGVFHCFGGNETEALELLHTFPQFMLGIGGVVTFKKSALPLTLQHAVPLSRLVVETDAPYLAPTPHRGKRNEPSFVPHILDRLCEVYSLSRPQLETILEQNTLSTFPRLAETQQ